MEAAAKNAIKSRPRAGSEDDLSRGRGDETYENEQLEKQINRVAKNNTGKKSDEKDRVLDKLKAINSRLRKRLKDLNTKVEKAIERTESKRILATRKKKDNDIPHKIAVKDKEIDNAKFQLQGYEKEIESLQRRIDEISQVDKMLDSEQLLKEYNTQCADLRKQIKDLEKLSKDKGKALEKLTDGDDYNYKIRNMIDEVRMWKEKIKHRQDIYEKNENGIEFKSDRMNTLEKENQSLMEQIQSLNSKINLDPINKPK